MAQKKVPNGQYPKTAILTPILMRLHAGQNISKIFYAGPGVKFFAGSGPKFWNFAAKMLNFGVKSRKMGSFPQNFLKNLEKCVLDELVLKPSPV